MVTVWMWMSLLAVHERPFIHCLIRVSIIDNPNERDYVRARRHWNHKLTCIRAVSLPPAGHQINTFSSGIRVVFDGNNSSAYQALLFDVPLSLVFDRKPLRLMTSICAEFEFVEWLSSFPSTFELFEKYIIEIILVHESCTSIKDWVNIILWLKSKCFVEHYVYCTVIMTVWYGMLYIYIKALSR